MKELFSGYYRPSKEEFDTLWRDCIFVFDTNVLLNLYRYSPKTSEELISILTKLSDRLWLPHQVALEYQENRLDEIAQQEQVYDKVISTLDRTHDELAALLRRGHLSIDTDALFARIKKTFGEVKDELSERRKKHPELFEKDHIRESIASIFGENVGAAYEKTELDKIAKSGEERYAKEVPPGYKDGSKKGRKRYGAMVIEDKYGDLLLWFQILDKAKSEKKPVIFVTDDVKEDWWWMSKGRTMGPRPELVLEMQHVAEVMFYMYTPDRFLEYARDALGVIVEQASVDEVREVGESRLDWKEEIANALEALGGQASLSEIYDYIENTTTRQLPVSWQEIIRYTLQINNAESSAFRGSADLFRRVGRGQWALKEHLDDSGKQMKMPIEMDEAADKPKT